MTPIANLVHSYRQFYRPIRRTDELGAWPVKVAAETLVEMGRSQFKAATPQETVCGQIWQRCSGGFFAAPDETRRCIERFASQFLAFVGDNDLSPLKGAQLALLLSTANEIFQSAEDDEIRALDAALDAMPGNSEFGDYD